ncbi:regulatory protein Cox [Escherichia coli O145:H28]|uniref:Cox family DNA-binding protein n=1 Tax=Escherichia coli TaxID=562 RepID=UPI00123B1061|nr:regulatory protein Cox [Escherichia coli O145:H28]GEI64860.1 regulatory protein Cox [Escherichia coli O145:H28]
MLPSETMIWQPEFTDKTLSRKTGAVHSTVRTMIDAAKLPTIDFVKPGSVKTRASENWVYLPAFNEGMRKAFFEQPKERRDAWLLWLGL